MLGVQNRALVAALLLLSADLLLLLLLVKALVPAAMQVHFLPASLHRHSSIAISDIQGGGGGTL